MILHEQFFIHNNKFKNIKYFLSKDKITKIKYY